MITDPRRTFRQAVPTLLMAMIVLTQMYASGRLERIRAVDSLTLLAAGACIGLSIGKIATYIRQKKDSPAT